MEEIKNELNKIISDTRRGIGISSVLAIGKPGTKKNF